MSRDEMKPLSLKDKPPEDINAKALREAQEAFGALLSDPIGAGIEPVAPVTRKPGASAEASVAPVTRAPAGGTRSAQPAPEKQYELIKTDNKNYKLVKVEGGMLGLEIKGDKATVVDVIVGDNITSASHIRLPKQPAISLELDTTKDLYKQGDFLSLKQTDDTLTKVGKFEEVAKRVKKNNQNLDGKTLAAVTGGPQEIGERAAAFVLGVAYAPATKPEPTKAKAEPTAKPAAKPAATPVDAAVNTVPVPTAPAGAPAPVAPTAPAAEDPANLTPAAPLKHSIKSAKEYFVSLAQQMKQLGYRPELTGDNTKDLAEFRKFAAGHDKLFTHNEFDSAAQQLGNQKLQDVVKPHLDGEENIVSKNKYGMMGAVAGGVLAMLTGGGDLIMMLIMALVGFFLGSLADDNGVAKGLMGTDANTQAKKRVQERAEGKAILLGKDGNPIKYTERGENNQNIDLVLNTVKVGDRVEIVNYRTINPDGTMGPAHLIPEGVPNVIDLKNIKGDSDVDKADIATVGVLKNLHAAIHKPKLEAHEIEGTTYLGLTKGKAFEVHGFVTADKKQHFLAEPVSLELAQPAVSPATVTPGAKLTLAPDSAINKKILPELQATVKQAANPPTSAVAPAAPATVPAPAAAPDAKAPPTPAAPQPLTKAQQDDLDKRFAAAKAAFEKSDSKIDKDESEAIKTLNVAIEALKTGKTADAKKAIEEMKQKFGVNGLSSNEESIIKTVEGFLPSPVTPADTTPVSKSKAK